MLTKLLLVLIIATQCHAISSIASWYGHRGTIIQNVTVLEGGSLTNKVYKDGALTDYSLGNFPHGLYVNLSLCEGFDAAKDQTDDLLKFTEELTQVGTPIYTGGGLFANDHQFYTYGGLPYPEPELYNSSMMRFNVFPTISAPNLPIGVEPLTTLPSGLTTGFVTNGVYTSNQAQGKGYWLGGMESATQGEISKLPINSNASTHVAVSSSIFFRVDLTDQDPRVEMLEFPTWLAPRSEGGLVWLPFGEDGVLLAIGGVQVAGDLFQSMPESGKTETNIYGKFMTEIAIYDIANKEWHLQETLEEQNSPSQLASFCTVVAETQDHSSHLIYVYGGYDGTYISNETARDEVWALSVPSFQWTKVNDGIYGHRRMGHVCVSPNPTTMISIGGAIEQLSYLESDRSIDVFDLSTAEWTGIYDPDSNSNYTVPGSVVDQIGGTATGLGTTFTPSNLNGTLNTLFSTPYKGIRNSFSGYNCSNRSSDNGGGKRNHSKTGLIAGLSAGGGVLIVAALLFWWHKQRKNNRQGAERTEMRQRKIWSWFGRSSNDPEPELSHASAETGETIVANPGADYFGATKALDLDIHEVPGSNVTSPGWNNFSHASPNITSPALSGSHEVEAPSRQELSSQGQSPQMSIRDYPLYPRSIHGEFIRSIASDSQSVSQPSQSVFQGRHYGHISPYELPEDKSRDNLAEPNVMSLDQDRRAMDPARVGKSFNIEDDQHHPLTAVSPTRMARKPVATQSPVTPTRPEHHRHQSSLSDGMPALPSPNPEESKRQSRVIADLPDTESAANYPKQNLHRRPAGPLKSAYQENFEGRTY